MPQPPQVSRRRRSEQPVVLAAELRGAFIAHFRQLDVTHREAVTRLAAWMCSSTTRASCRCPRWRPWRSTSGTGWSASW